MDYYTVYETHMGALWYWTSSHGGIMLLDMNIYGTCPNCVHQLQRLQCCEYIRIIWGWGQVNNHKFNSWVHYVLSLFIHIFISLIFDTLLITHSVCDEMFLEITIKSSKNANNHMNVLGGSHYVLIWFHTYHFTDIISLW